MSSSLQPSRMLAEGLQDWECRGVAHRDSLYLARPNPQMLFNADGSSLPIVCLLILAGTHHMGQRASQQRCL